MKRVSGNKHELVVSVPPVARMTIVAIEPTSVVVVLDVEQLEITVRVGNKYEVPSMPPLFDRSVCDELRVESYSAS